MRSVARRLLTIPAVSAATAAVTATLPVWLPLTWLLSFLPPLGGALRSALFVAGYLWCETIGIVVSFAIWCRHGFCRRGSPRYPAFLDDNFRLQCWWANALKVLAERSFELRFHVTGREALPGGSVIFVPRHASIGDTVIPIVYYARPFERRLRYVLKRELLLDPCLDIVGNRLPNYFVDRAAVDSAAEVRGVLGLLDNLGDDGILIYPEGTRFSAAKRERILARRGADPAAARWTRLLPPRYGGITALLAHNPGLDLMFCAHVGFEGSSHFSSLVNGAWIGAVVRIHFWRVAHQDVPREPAAQRAFLIEAWDRMHDAVEELSRGLVPAGKPR